jgi:hypothetical protein
MSLLIVGWFIGLMSSLFTSFLIYWFQKKHMQAEKRQSDIRIALNWEKSQDKVNMRGFDLSGANLSGKDFTNADLEDANFSGASLLKTTFLNSNLRQANFKNATIVRANFTYAHLSRSNFKGSIIEKSDFSFATVQKTNFLKIKKYAQCRWDHLVYEEGNKPEVDPKLQNDFFADAENEINPV